MVDNQVVYLQLDIEWKPKVSSRKKFWSSVLNSFRSDNTAKTNSDNSQSNNLAVDVDELKQIEKLADGASWLDFITSEWNDIFSALYTEFQSRPIDSSVLNKIQKDTHRTFSLFIRNTNAPSISSFRINATEYIEALKNVLVSVSHQGRGYTQGMNFIAAFLLLSTNKDEQKSYILLSFLLQHRYLDMLYNHKSSCLLEYMKAFEKKLRKFHKRIYRALKEKEYPNICYSLEWFTTCFIVSCPKNLGIYVIDLLFANISDIFIRIGLAIMKHLENFIINATHDELHMNFKNMVMNVDPFVIITSALAIDLGGDHSTSILQTMLNNVEKMAPKNNEYVDTLRDPDIIALSEDESPRSNKKKLFHSNEEDNSDVSRYDKLPRRKVRAAKPPIPKRSSVSPPPGPLKSNPFINSAGLFAAVGSGWGNLSPDQKHSENNPNQSKLNETPRNKKRRRPKEMRIVPVEIKRRINIEITERMIAYLRYECESTNDNETVLRRHILSIAGNQTNRTQLDSPVIETSHKLSKNPKKRRNISGGIFDGILLWNYNKSVTALCIDDVSADCTVDESKSKPSSGISDISSMESSIASYHSTLSLEYYSKYRQSLFSVCEASRNHMNRSRNSFSPRSMRNRKNNNISNHSATNETFASTPTAKNPSFRYLGFDILTSKSFWMFTIGMKSRINRALLPPIAESGKNDDEENEKLSDLGYSSEDELPVVYFSESDKDKHERLRKRSKYSTRKIEHSDNQQSNVNLRISSTYSAAIDAVSTDWFGNDHDIGTLTKNIADIQLDMSPKATNPSDSNNMMTTNTSLRENETNSSTQHFFMPENSLTHTDTQVTVDARIEGSSLCIPSPSGSNVENIQKKLSHEVKSKKYSPVNIESVRNVRVKHLKNNQLMMEQNSKKNFIPRGRRIHSNNRFSDYLKEFYDGTIASSNDHDSIANFFALPSKSSTSSSLPQSIPDSESILESDLGTLNHDYVLDWSSRGYKEHYGFDSDLSDGVGTLISPIMRPAKLMRRVTRKSMKKVHGT